MKLILVLDFDETIHQLIMGTNIHWYACVLWSVDGYVLGKALGYEVKGQRKKGRQRRTWK